MRYLATALTCGFIAIATTGCSGKQSQSASTGAETEEQKALYALGAAVSRQVASFDLTEEELKHVQRGFADGALKKDVGDIQEYFPQIQELQNQRIAAAAEAEKKAGDEYIAKAAAEPGAVQTPSGLIYKEITAGTGPSPSSTDVVNVHYHGTLRDGKVFDSSIERNEPVSFPLNAVIPCWTEGVQMMKVGGKSRLICPSALAYGDRGAPPDIKPGATLIFDVELLGIESDG
ncbi:MAG TPA: FKBP-type peptidyl-prolyl cis-trans isomerase [Steroidobacteraceae bacterium]